jgi:hypothetical protein
MTAIIVTSNPNIDLGPTALANFCQVLERLNRPYQVVTFDKRLCAVVSLKDFSDANYILKKLGAHELSIKEHLRSSRAPMFNVNRMKEFLDEHDERLSNAS